MSRSALQREERRAMRESFESNIASRPDLETPQGKEKIMCETMTVGGKTYMASLIEPGFWIVRRWEGFSVDFSRDYTECEVHVQSPKPADAIHAAIEQGSWA